MASAPNIEKLCPIWPTKDIAGTEAFYAALGFRTVYREDNENYLIIKREMAELHFYDRIQDVPGIFVLTFDDAGETLFCAGGEPARIQNHQMTGLERQFDHGEPCQP